MPPRTNDDGSGTPATLKLSASNPVPVESLLEKTTDVNVVPAFPLKLT